MTRAEQIRQRMLEITPEKQTQIDRSREEIRRGEFVVLVPTPDDDEEFHCHGTPSDNCHYCGSRQNIAYFDQDEDGNWLCIECSQKLEAGVMKSELFTHMLETFRKRTEAVPHGPDWSETQMEEQRQKLRQQLAAIDSLWRPVLDAEEERRLAQQERVTTFKVLATLKIQVLEQLVELDRCQHNRWLRLSGDLTAQIRELDAHALNNNL